MSCVTRRRERWTPRTSAYPRRVALPRTIAATLAIGLLVAACGGSDGDGGSGDETPLAGEYLLVEGRGPSGEVPILDAGRVTLRIDGEQWAGTAACNSYSGTVTRDGGQLTVGEVLRAEMACLDEGVMRAEGAYLAAFAVVDAFTRTADRLVLRGPDTELVFEAVPPEPDAALVGTTWLLTSLVDGSGDDGAVSSVMGEPNLEFRDDGTFSGETGCNLVEGRFERDGDRLSTTDVSRSDAACADTMATAQDERVAAVLASDGIRVTLEGASLRLIGADDRGLDYRAGP